MQSAVVAADSHENGPVGWEGGLHQVNQNKDYFALNYRSYERFHSDTSIHFLPYAPLVTYYMRNEAGYEQLRTDRDESPYGYRLPLKVASIAALEA